MNLSVRLQRELADRGLTVTELARESGLARGTVDRAVQGVGNITVRNAARILAALGLELVITPILPSWPSEATKEAEPVLSSREGRRSA